ncbi:MAG: hypothetical protein ACOX2L_05990 [Anaerolineae bacterium]|jgi:hypothetical protein|nr:hypothetical protein [Chloroflexota bacterium]
MSKNGTAAMREHGGATDDNGGNHRQAHSTAGQARPQPLHGSIVRGIWTKPVHGSVHMLHTPPAWALDVDDVQAAERGGATMIHIHDLETRHHYWATIETLRRRGFPLNRGYGDQLGLLLQYWAPLPEEAQAASHATPQHGTTATGPLAVQGVLW